MGATSPSDRPIARSRPAKHKSRPRPARASIIAIGAGSSQGEGVKTMDEVEKAAETVARAMHALAAHRHETGPTLERQYRAALEAYFVVAERAAGRERADGEPEIASPSFAVDGAEDDIAEL